MDGEKSDNWIFKYLQSDKVALHEYPSCGGSLLIHRIYDFISACGPFIHFMPVKSRNFVSDNFGDCPADLFVKELLDTLSCC